MLGGRCWAGCALTSGSWRGREEGNGSKKINKSQTQVERLRRAAAAGSPGKAGGEGEAAAG